MTTYLGLSCSQHDPSIAVVSDQGELVFAEANERPLKYKRGWHAPADALGVIEPILDRFVLGEKVSANITWSNAALRSVGYLARASRLLTRGLEVIAPAHLDAKLWQVWTFRQALYRAPTSAADLLLNLQLRLLERNDFQIQFCKQSWNHHLCHAATACYSSPFEEALCIVVDGMGEGTSTSIFSFRDGKIEKLESTFIPGIASLGIFYSQICYAAGFDPLAGEEWKVMGLAAYGKRDDELYQLMRPHLKVVKNQFSLTSASSARLSKLLSFRKRGYQANADLAFTAQVVFEEVLFEFLTLAHRRWGGENLILTGGCALNSSANGKITSSTPFRNLHVPCAPGDDGNSAGAALLAWQQDHPQRQVPRFSSPYLGTHASEDSIARLQKFGIKSCFKAVNSEQLSVFVAKELAAGSIVGWMQGRAEFGARALGNRSILADPRFAGIKDRLNANVKSREEFRPFAPSILHEFGPDYFEDYAYAPYMERTLKWRKDKAPAGVKHLDDTGRLQSVTREQNPQFYSLISAFHQETGCPILLNTSFNVMGRPMVHDTEDAIGVFLTSGIDLLVLGLVAFKKNEMDGSNVITAKAVDEN
jgi:carbamoyltransferase